MTESLALKQRANARVGHVIADKWKLESLLGIGGMATVYAARHRNGKRVAIKILHPELCLSQEALVRFVREGYLSNLVEHPGSVSVLDDGALTDGTPFIVMEYLEGETLDARCERLTGKIDLPDMLAIADVVLDVLAAAHKGGLIHRDIKPENVFLTSDGGVKVLDFGIARLADLTGVGASATLTGSALGTPTFMSPEQAKGDKELIDGRTDLWAVGATIFNALTGQYVHVGKSVNELLVAAMMKPARSLGVVLKDGPQALIDVVDRSLAYEPSDRYQSAADMQEALREGAVKAGINVPLRPSLMGYMAPPPPPRATYESLSDPQSSIGHASATHGAPATMGPGLGRPAVAAPSDQPPTHLSSRPPPRSALDAEGSQIDRSNAPPTLAEVVLVPRAQGDSARAIEAAHVARAGGTSQGGTSPANSPPVSVTTLKGQPPSHDAPAAGIAINASGAASGASVPGPGATTLPVAVDAEGVPLPAAAAPARGSTPSFSSGNDAVSGAALDGEPTDLARDAAQGRSRKIALGLVAALLALVLVAAGLNAVSGSGEGRANGASSGDATPPSAAQSTAKTPPDSTGSSGAPGSTAGTGSTSTDPATTPSGKAASNPTAPLPSTRPGGTIPGRNPRGPKDLGDSRN